MKADCKPLNIEEKKSEYYFDKLPGKSHKKSSYYIKNSSKPLSEYLLSDLRMYIPHNLHDGTSFTDIHAASEENFYTEINDNDNAIGNIMTIGRLTKQIHNLSNGFHCPIIRNGELFFVSENDDIKTAIEIDSKISIKEYEIK